MKSAFFFTWLTALIVPFTIIMLGVRLLLMPSFLELEYRMPRFPSDKHGLTAHERIALAKKAVTFLLSAQSSVKRLGVAGFNARETKHLDDVRDLIQLLLKLWYLCLALLLLFALIAWFTGHLSAYFLGWYYGGWLTVGIILALGLLVLFAFDWLFDHFHEFIFPADSWLFYETDMLMRLFPLRFWQDCALYLISISLVGGLILLLIGWVRRRKKRQQDTVQ